MAKKTRVKVVRNTSFGSPEQQLQEMIRKFKKSCDSYGIKTLLKRYESFESKGQKRRRKKLEVQNKMRYNGDK